MGNRMSVSYKGMPDIVKRLNKLEAGGEKAIKSTVSEFASRGAGWVSQGIRQHYGVDTAAIRAAAKKPRRGHTTIKVAGKTVDGATLVYEGRPLTPLHFKMTPKAQPKTRLKKPIRIPGQAIATAQGSPVAMVRPPKKYDVKATIILGKASNLGTGAFLAQGNGGKSLPYQKTGEGRMPIEAIHTLSVPQMIDGRARDTIEETINTNLEGRFKHHIERATK